MTALLDELMAQPSLPVVVLAARMIGTLVLCGLIGWDREIRSRSAGLRTHMLVGLASTVYCLITLAIVARFHASTDAVRIDPVRMVEAVTGGVAFLVAGMIVFSRGKVHGLTTGAGLWLSAAIGLAVGLGLWTEAVLTTGLALVVIRLIRIVEKSIPERDAPDTRKPDKD